MTQSEFDKLKDLIEFIDEVFLEKEKDGYDYSVRRLRKVWDTYKYDLEDPDHIDDLEREIEDMGQDLEDANEEIEKLEAKVKELESKLAAA